MNKLRVVNILNLLKDIADPEYQERAWLRGEIHWPCSFGELISKLYDDSRIEQFVEEEFEKYNITESKIVQLRQLVKLIDRFCLNPDIYLQKYFPLIADETRVIKNPDWKEIRVLAENILKSFEKMDYGLEDKEWWLEFILSAVAKYSDSDQQQQMWVEKKEIFYSTPLDMYQELFRYSDFDYFMDEYAERFGLTKEQIEALNRFRFQIKLTPFVTANCEDIVGHPDWRKLQSLAKRVGEVFPP